MDKFKRGLKIWIDAITINQDDEVEKDAQILIMHQIYERAGNVVVWIGPQSDTEFDHWGKGSKCTSCSAVIAEEKSEVLRTIKVFEEISRYYPTEQFGNMDDSRDLRAAHQHREAAAFRLRMALSDWKELMLENPDFFSEQMYVSMRKFFDREYWRRLWIIQELAMGNARMPVICGDRVTHWYHIRNAAILLHSAMDVVGEMTVKELGVEETVDAVGHMASHVAGIAQLEFLSHRKKLPEINRNLLEFTSRPGIGGGDAVRGSTLDQALVLAMQANCKMDKDRIRGILHIHGIPTYMRTEGVFNFEEMPTADVYRIFATKLLEMGRLEILTLLDGCSDDLVNASWIPNSACPASRRTNPIHGPWFADGVNRFDNSGNPFHHVPEALPLVMEVEPGTHALVLKGVTIVDVIDGVGAMQPALAARSRVHKNSRFVTGVVQPTKPKTKTNPLYEREHVVKRCIYRTLTCSTDVSGREKDFKRLLSCFSPDAPHPTHPSFWNWNFFNATADLKFHSKSLRDWMEPFQQLPDLYYADDTQRKDWGEASAAMAAMKAKVRGRRLFLAAERGFLGLGPMITQPGNVLATVFGCAKPLILMPLGNRTFKILGEYYVDDIMEGELEKMEIPDDNIGPIFVV